MLASICPTFSACSTSTWLGSGHRSSSTYYYRSKFLLAPDASTLAEPLFGATPNDQAERSPKRPTASYLSNRLRPELKQFTAITGSFTNVVGRWTRDAQHDANNNYINDTTQEPPEKVHNVAFPLPPTLADIQRMEPDLSPISAMRRAGDISSYQLMKIALPAFRSAPHKPTITPTDKSSDVVTYGHLNVVTSTKSAAHSPFIPLRKWPHTSLPERSVAEALGASTPDDEVIFFSPRRTVVTHNPEITLRPTDQHETGIAQPTHSGTKQFKHVYAIANCVKVPPLEPSVQTSPDSWVLAKWLSDYLHFTVTKDAYSLEAAGPGAGPFSHSRYNVARNIYTVITCSHTSFTVILSCLWYISRLVPCGIVNSRDVQEGSIERLICRLFLLGVVLADKWQNDDPLLMKQWKLVSDLTVKSLIKLETSALLALEYKLNISGDTWRNWLVKLRSHFTLCEDSRDQEQRLLLSRVIDEALGRINVTRQRGLLYRKVDPIARPPPASLLRSLHLKLVEGLATICIPQIINPKPREFRQPASWNPDSDPIIGNCRRTSCVAPLPAHLKLTPVTASTILANILNNPPSLPSVCRAHRQTNSYWPTNVTHQGHHDFDHSNHLLQPHLSCLAVRG